MSTIRQKKLAQNIIANMKAKKPQNKMELVASVGYSALSAEKKSKEIIESKGVQEELKVMGFSAENAKRVIAEVMDKEYAEDKDRLKAAELTLKVTGDFAAEKSVNVNVNAEEMSLLIQQGLNTFRSKAQ